MSMCIGFTGDFCPWKRMEDKFVSGDWKDSFQSVLPFFKENDLNIFDLECPLTESEDKLVKTGPHIKALPKTAEILRYLHCDLVATANNHFKDYGWEGMNATYKALTNQDVEWMGSGENISEASRIVYKEFGDCKIAFINVTENEWTTTVNEESGCNSLDVISVYNAIQYAKEISNFVVVIAHGGHEHYHLPSPRMKKTYRFFVDAGASAVVGHHTHIISGFETYKQAPIFYSLGNFCFDWEGMRGKPWNKGMILRLKFDKNKPVEYEFEFVHQLDDEVSVKLISGENRADLLKTVQLLNSIISDDQKLQESFDQYAKSLQPLICTWLEPYEGKILPSLHFNGWIPNLFSKKKKRLLMNLVHCESHRDILLNTLKNNS